MAAANSVGAIRGNVLRREDLSSVDKLVSDQQSITQGQKDRNMNQSTRQRSRSMTPPWRYSSLGLAVMGILALSSIGKASDLTPCPFVQSREFSEVPDRNAAGILDPGQTLFFDCFAGNVFTDSLRDYGAEIDGLGVRDDKWFSEVVDNEVTLIVSMEDNRNIYYERVGGQTGLWEDKVARDYQGMVGDVDALEVWGDSLSDHYSSPGDPTGNSIISTSAMFPNPITQADILAIIQSIPAGLNLTATQIDVDGFMRQNIDSNRVIFSIAPVGQFDGGEIFVGDVNTLTGSYLNHGGHLWDTDFDVMGTFGVPTENINAIEAIHFVPEPSTALLLGIGLLGLCFNERRRRRNSPVAKLLQSP